MFTYLNHFKTKILIHQPSRPFLYEGTIFHQKKVGKSDQDHAICKLHITTMTARAKSLYHPLLVMYNATHLKLWASGGRNGNG